MPPVPPTEYRYAKLVAVSEAAGKPWSSVAELYLLGPTKMPLPRAGWKVTADSEELVDEVAPATNAIDGNPATFWHSAWVVGGMGDAPLPHELVVDLGMPQQITGFRYLPRPMGENGLILGYEFYLSTDGQNWGASVVQGSFSTGNRNEIEVLFPTK